MTIYKRINIWFYGWDLLDSTIYINYVANLEDIIHKNGFHENLNLDNGRPCTSICRLARIDFFNLANQCSIWLIIISVFKKFSIKKKKKSVSLAKVSRPHITWMFTSCPFCMHADWKRSQLIDLLVLLEGQLAQRTLDYKTTTLNGVFSITLCSNSPI